MALALKHTSSTLAGFACVGFGFAAIVPMVFSAAGSRPDVSPGIAVASVTTLGYLGFLIGPPLIGFAAELFGLRCGLAIIIATSLIAAGVATTLRQPGGVLGRSEPEE